LSFKDIWQLIITFEVNIDFQVALPPLVPTARGVPAGGRGLSPSAIWHGRLALLEGIVHQKFANFEPQIILDVMRLGLVYNIQLCTFYMLCRCHYLFGKDPFFFLDSDPHFGVIVHVFFEQSSLLILGHLEGLSDDHREIMSSSDIEDSHLLKEVVGARCQPHGGVLKAEASLLIFATDPELVLDINHEEVGMASAQKSDLYLIWNLVRNAVTHIVVKFSLALALSEGEHRVVP
jgi:hypothetical protein